MSLLVFCFGLSVFVDCGLTLSSLQFQFVFVIWPSVLLGFGPCFENDFFVCLVVHHLSHTFVYWEVVFVWLGVFYCFIVVPFLRCYC